MAKPSVPGAGTTEIWSSGEYRNYVRDMMTNFGSQYNRRREAETSVSDPGRQSKDISMKSMSQDVGGDWKYNSRHFFVVGAGALRHVVPLVRRLTPTIIIQLMLHNNLSSTSSPGAGRISQFETEIIIRLVILSWHIMRLCPDSCLKGLQKTAKKLRQLIPTPRFETETSQTQIKNANHFPRCSASC